MLGWPTARVWGGSRPRTRPGNPSPPCERLGPLTEPAGPSHLAPEPHCPPGCPSSPRSLLATVWDAHPCSRPHQPAPHSGLRSSVPLLRGPRMVLLYCPDLVLFPALVSRQPVGLWAVGPWQPVPCLRAARERRAALTLFSG